MNFKTNCIYIEDLSANFGSLSSKQLSLTLRDGRASALLVYEHLLARYKNLQRTENEDYPADCVTITDGRVLQVRMVTNNGLALNPHKQNGICRRYNRLEHMDARKRVAGYILVDVTKAPRFTYSFVPMARVPEDAKFSCEDAQSLISLATSN